MLRANRHFQLLWLSNLLFFTASWAQTLIFGWVTYQLTDSALGVAVFTAIRYTPMLLGPVSGAYADRLNRVALLVVASCLALLVTVVLAVMESMETLTYGSLVLGGLLLGLAESPSQPARTSLVFELVGTEDLAVANSFNAMATGLTQIIGPALGGALVAALGVSVSFYVLAAFYLVSTVLLFPLPRGAAQPGGRAAEGIGAMVVSGFKVALRSPVVTGVLLVTLVANLLIWPVYQSLLPVFAAEMGLNADGFGFLLGSCSAGGLLGTAILARAGNFRGMARAFWLGTAAWGLAWAVFALSESQVALAFLSIVVAGILSAVFGSLRVTLLMFNTEPHLHGRVFGLLEFVIGAMPLGSLLLGAIAESVGVVTTTVVAGVLFVGVVAVIGWRLPELRSAHI